MRREDETQRLRAHALLDRIVDSMEAVDRAAYSQASSAEEEVAETSPQTFAEAAPAVRLGALVRLIHDTCVGLGNVDRPVHYAGGDRAQRAEDGVGTAQIGDNDMLFDRVLARPIQRQLIDVQDTFVPQHGRREGAQPDIVRL